MRRAVERHMEDPLAELLLRSEVGKGDKVVASRIKGEKKLNFEVVESDPGTTPETEPVEHES